MPQPSARTLHAERALLPDGWARDVAVTIDGAGRIAAVTLGADPAGLERVAGPLLPAMANLHSHAFQRAMAGLAETAGPGDDSFWTWREAMYRTVARMTPEAMEAVAAKLYVELLRGGFGAVAEFHYLHHTADGTPHADPAELSHRILKATADTGIGLTLLPVFYAHAGFGGVAATPGQRPFLHDTDGFARLIESLAAPCRDAGAGLGLAVHSLRAATPEEIARLLPLAGAAAPIHIHVAEQEREVDDCLAWSGRRPVRFLLDELPVDGRWCLIHATHLDEGEAADIVARGAIAGLCPATEANLGDGLFPAVAHLSRGGRFGIGTDSHVATGVAEELRTLEYGQRLTARRRNRLAGGPGRSVGRTLYDGALAGGATALGQPLGAIAPGRIASFTVLDGDDPFIAATEGDALLDRWIFALGDRAVRDVMVAGHWRIRDGRHARDREIDAAFRAALTQLA